MISGGSNFRALLHKPGKGATGDQAEGPTSALRYPICYHEFSKRAKVHKKEAVSK